MDTSSVCVPVLWHGEFVCHLEITARSEACKPLVRGHRKEMLKNYTCTLVLTIYYISALIGVRKLLYVAPGLWTRGLDPRLD